MSDTGITSGTPAARATSRRHAVNIFATIGIGQWFRYVVGAQEIAGAVGVLVSRLSGLAALGLLCLMAGAILTNVLVLGTSPLLPIVLMLVSALVAWGRWPRTSTLFTKSEAGRLQ
jgi:putative oxidoreductase